MEDEVWVMRDDHMCVEHIYRDEEKAKNDFEERVRYYEGHKEATMNDHWTYRLFQKPSANHFMFDAFLRGEWRKVIGVYYVKVKVL